MEELSELPGEEGLVRGGETVPTRADLRDMAGGELFWFAGTGVFEDCRFEPVVDFARADDGREARRMAFIAARCWG